MSKRISTCDNHSGTPRYVVKEEVRDIQVFTSKVIPGNVSKDRMSFCDICVLARAGKEFFNDADMTRSKIRVVAWKMHSLAEH